MTACCGRRRCRCSCSSQVALSLWAHWRIDDCEAHATDHHACSIHGGSWLDRLLTPSQFDTSDGVEEWRVIVDGTNAFFTASSFAASAAVVQAIAALPRTGEIGTGVNIRHDGVTIRLFTQADAWCARAAATWSSPGPSRPSPASTAWRRTRPPSRACPSSPAGRTRRRSCRSGGLSCARPRRWRPSPPRRRTDVVDAR